jgi:hypothetical protein
MFLSVADWFLGWPQHGHYNRQPNDDGLSEQDCVEARRIYSLPTASASLASAFMWNDRDCSTPNYFICERLQNDGGYGDNFGTTGRVIRSEGTPSPLAPGASKFPPRRARREKLLKGRGTIGRSPIDRKRSSNLVGTGG